MIRPITAEETIAVRWPVLRPGFPRETAVFAGDELPSTFHLGTFLGDSLVGVVSLYLVPPPWEPSATNTWQLRGMATLAEVRGGGHGAALLAASAQALKEAGARQVWCNARTSAAPFYQRYGWETRGDEFEIPSVGPHFHMWLAL